MVVPVSVCIDATGAVSDVTIERASAFPAYDDRRVRRGFQD